MSPAAIAEIDESAAGPASLGGLVDEEALDRQQQRQEHPFSKFCVEVREACGLPDSQRSREVVSEVCNAVARLTTVAEADVKAQAEHIAKMVSDDRKLMKDPQLWLGPATKIALHALKLRGEGKGIIADPVND
jgi:hypothetical protein